MFLLDSQFQYSVAEHCGKSFDLDNGQSKYIEYNGENLHGQECKLEFRNRDVIMGRVLCLESHQLWNYSSLAVVTVKIYQYSYRSGMPTKVMYYLHIIIKYKSAGPRINILFIITHHKGSF